MSVDRIKPGVAHRRMTPAMLAAEQQVDIGTVYRWIRKGVRGVRLSTTTVGGRRVILRAVYLLWQDCITRRMNAELEPATRQRRRQAAR